MKSVFLILILAQSAPPDVPGLIDQLGHRKWHVRHEAMLTLHELMIADPQVFRQVRESLATNAELSLESERRHERLIAEYYRLAAQHYSEVSGARNQFNAPAPYIWSLPRELRFVDDRDVAAELYQAALAELLSNWDISIDGEILNHELVMRYATHLFVIDYLDMYHSHAELNALMEAMLASQAADDARLLEHLESIGWHGRIELRTAPPAIEDRTGETAVTRYARTFYFRREEGGPA